MKYVFIFLYFNFKVSFYLIFRAFGKSNLNGIISELTQQQIQCNHKHKHHKHNNKRKQNQKQYYHKQVVKN